MSQLIALTHAGHPRPGLATVGARSSTRVDDGESIEPVSLQLGHQTQTGRSAGDRALFYFPAAINALLQSHLVGDLFPRVSWANAVARSPGCPPCRASMASNLGVRRLSDSCSRPLMPSHPSITRGIRILTTPWLESIELTLGKNGQVNRMRSRLR